MSVSEKFRGVSGDYNSRSVDFIVKDVSTEGDAITDTVVYIYSTYGGAIDGLPLQNVSVEEISYPKGIFQTTATFGRQEEEENDTGDIEVSFDINLDSRRIYRSIETVSTDGQYVRPGGKSRKMHGRINVNADGIAEGVDVRVPVGGFQVSWFAPNASVTESYRKTVLHTVSKINNASFYGFDAGEVMFVGATGRRRNADDWELTFRFETMENKTDITVGEGTDQITGIDVEGWQLLNVDFERGHRLNNDGTVTDIFVPREAYIERIYESADFSVLGIGT